MLVVNHDSLTFRLSASILLSLIHRGNSAPRRPWENHPQNYIKSCHTRIRPFPLKTNGTCGPINGPPQPSAMPAGKLCSGGSINPQIKGCIYIWHIWSWPNLSFSFCAWFESEHTPKNCMDCIVLVLQIGWDNASWCSHLPTKAPVEGLGSHSGVLGNNPGGVWVKLRSLGKEESKDSCLPENEWVKMNL